MPRWSDGSTGRRVAAGGAGGGDREGSACSRLALGAPGKRRCRGYNNGGGRRAWRGLGLGPVWVCFQAQAPQVTCPRHGVVVAATPWARSGSRLTRAFDDQVPYVGVHRGHLCARHVEVDGRRGRPGHAELAGKTDRLSAPRRIGIDEICYRQGRRSIILRVIDQDTGRQVWAGRIADEPGGRIAARMAQGGRSDV